MSKVKHQKLKCQWSNHYNQSVWIGLAHRFYTDVQYFLFSLGDPPPLVWQKTRLFPDFFSATFPKCDYWDFFCKTRLIYWHLACQMYIFFKSERSFLGAQIACFVYSLYPSMLSGRAQWKSCRRLLWQVNGNLMQSSFSECNIDCWFSSAEGSLESEMHPKCETFLSHAWLQSTN